VRSRIGNIRDFLPLDMTMEEFRDRLLSALARDGLTNAALEERELAQIRALAEEKYRSWEWTCGNSPPFGKRNRAHYAGGKLEVRLDIGEGRISGISFGGDFLARRPLDELTAALTGCRYRREAVFEVLARFPVSDLFGGITVDEVMAVVFA
jgi:lipoate-protein ligase A